MRLEYPREVVDGGEVEPLVVDRDGVLPSGHMGSIYIDGAHVEQVGVHQGSLWLEGEATLVLRGIHQGSLHVGNGCLAEVTGTVQGSIHIAFGGEVTIALSGQHQGSLHNDGAYVLGGTRGGSVDGDGSYVELPGSSVKQPVMRGGVAFYEWRR